MISIVFVVAASAAIIGVRFAWQLHPWMPAGRSLAIGHWQFGGYEFQVWQRKNPDTFEPFSDGLFVRQGTNPWQVFCFDIQDSYLPPVRLQQDQGKIIVYRDGENRGVYDMATQTFQRHGQVFAPESIGGGTNPPGNWWLR